jgi:hypothetical protein
LKYYKIHLRFRLSGIQRREISWKPVGVSEEYVLSIFRVEEYAKQRQIRDRNRVDLSCDLSNCFFPDPEFGGNKFPAISVDSQQTTPCYSPDDVVGIVYT